MKVSDEERAEMVILRGLGYSMEEVGDELGVSRQTVSHHLTQFKREAEEGSRDMVFLDILVKGKYREVLTAGKKFLRSVVEEKTSLESDED